jgi:hypothetical protein
MNVAVTGLDEETNDGSIFYLFVVGLVQTYAVGVEKFK